MRRQLLPAFVMVIVTTVLLGLGYPLVVTGMAQLLFDDQAEGSLVERDGDVVGSRWIGQSFTAPQYFHPRPSAAGENGYDGSLSYASAVGPDERGAHRRGRGARRCATATRTVSPTTRKCPSTR